MADLPKTINDTLTIIAITQGRLSNILDRIKDVDNQLVRQEVLGITRHLSSIVDITNDYVLLAKAVLNYFPADTFDKHRRELDAIEISISEARRLDNAAFILETSLARDGLSGIRATGNLVRETLNVFGAEIAQSLVEFRELMKATPDSVADSPRRGTLNQLQNLSQSLETEVKVAQIQVAGVEAQEVLQTVKETASEAGDVKLGHYFDAYAKRERLAARLLRYATSLFLVATAGGAAVIVFFLQSHGLQGGIWQQLTKLSIVVPLGILAAYLGRESSKHRDAAQWAEEVRIQLLTFDAFVGAMDRDDAKSLRARFGDRVFAARAAFEGRFADSRKIAETARELISPLREPKQ